MFFFKIHIREGNVSLAILFSAMAVNSPSKTKSLIACAEALGEGSQKAENL